MPDWFRKRWLRVCITIVSAVTLVACNGPKQPFWDGPHVSIPDGAFTTCDNSGNSVTVTIDNIKTGIGKTVHVSDDTPGGLNKDIDATAESTTVDWPCTEAVHLGGKGLGRTGGTIYAEEDGKTNSETTQP